MADETLRDAVHGNRLNDVKVCMNDDEYELDVNQADEHLWTYLMYAVRYAYNDIALYLLEKGANIHAMKGDGNTCLHIAAREGHLETVQLLLEHGASVVCRNKSGIQPHLLARQQGHKECEEILVSAMKA